MASAGANRIGPYFYDASYYRQAGCNQIQIVLLYFPCLGDIGHGFLRSIRQYGLVLRRTFENYLIPH